MQMLRYSFFVFLSLGYYTGFTQSKLFVTQKINV